MSESYVDMKAFKRDIKRLKRDTQTTAEKTILQAYDTLDLHHLPFDEVEAIPVKSKSSINITFAAANEVSDTFVESVLDDAAETVENILVANMRRLLK